jgi:hypothetical protein
MRTFRCRLSLSLNGRFEVTTSHTCRAFNGRANAMNFLLPDAAKRGYHVFVTKDNNQLNDPDQTSLIRKSKLHHVRFDQGNRGVSDYARAVGCLVAAMYDVMEELQAADGQRLVKITKLDASKRRHETINPKTDPPAYWRSSPSRKPRRVK